MPHFQATAQQKVNKFAYNEWIVSRLCTAFVEQFGGTLLSLYVTLCLCNVKEAFFFLSRFSVDSVCCCCCCVVVCPFGFQYNCLVRGFSHSITPLSAPQKKNEKKSVIKILGKIIVFSGIIGERRFPCINISHKIVRSIEIAKYFDAECSS